MSSNRYLHFPPSAMKHRLFGLVSSMLMGAVCAAPPANMLAERSSPRAQQAEVKAPSYGKGPLTADQLRGIQGIGRAVLVANQGQGTDPETVALKQEVENLAKEFDRALAANLSAISAITPVRGGKASKEPIIIEPIAMTPRTFNLSMEKDGTFKLDEVKAAASPLATSQTVISQRAESQGIAVADSDPFVSVKQRLHQIEARLGQHAATAKAQGKPERQVHSQAMSGAVAQLREELHSALSSSGEDSAKRIAALREKFRLQGFAAQSVAADADNTSARSEPTPTLSTLTQHR